MFERKGIAVWLLRPPKMSRNIFSNLKWEQLVKQGLVEMIRESPTNKTTEIAIQLKTECLALLIQKRIKGKSENAYMVLSGYS